MKNSKLKIVVLSHRFSPDIGGIEINSEILATEFQLAGHDVRLLTWSAEAKLNNKSFSFKVVRKPAPDELVANIRWADAVFENNLALRLSWPLIFIKRAHVIAIRTTIARSDGRITYRDRLKFKWLAKAQGVIAVSESIRREHWHDAVVIGNPYREQLFYNIAGDRPLQSFVFLGRLVSDKGCDLAIQAADLIAQQTSKTTTLTIIGSGPAEAVLRAIPVHSPHLTVTYKGPLLGDALISEMNRHRYQFIPTKTIEAFGNVALEGMACGCVVVSSNIGGLPEAVGDAGILVSPDNAQNFADAALKLIQNDELRKEFSIKMEAHLSRHKSPEVAAKYLNVIRKAHEIITKEKP